MLTKLRTLASLYRQAGFRWSAFRVAYAFRLRTGLIRLQMPQYKWADRPLETWLKKDIPSTPESYAQWRKNNSPKFFFDSLVGAGSPRPALQWNPQIAIDEANRILSGEIKYFAHEFHQTGFPPNWHKDPVSGIELSSNKHWSQISDDGEVDIKFIWEASRFSMVYTLVRAYASSQDERYAEAFWNLILDWAEHNPPNTGPNWMDGQEISLRLMAWTFGFYAFLNSPSSTPERIAKFTTFVGAQARRIYQNIDYAISTHSNHTISEACGLWLVGTLFPELKDSEKYLSLGRKLLEQEAIKQIFPDGSYSMYSLNYHRFILQIYLYAMRLGELNDSPLSESVKRIVTKSIEHLYQLIDLETGQMPVYGSNDGALVLPLNNCDFTDYRPLLQLGYFVASSQHSDVSLSDSEGSLSPKVRDSSVAENAPSERQGKRLFESGAWDEDLFWLCGEPGGRVAAGSRYVPSELLDHQRRIETTDSKEITSFSDGGIYIIHNTNSKAVIRCTDYQSRPSHADQLHVDLWMKGHNIACDAGTYLYSGKGVWRNRLAHTSAHNTVTVDSNDQMKMVSRFTWTDWAKGKILQNKENLWQGEHDGYKPVSHKRTVMSLDNDRWLVVDNLLANESHHYALHWLLSDCEYGVQELAPAKFEIQLKYQTSKLVDSKIKIQMGLTKGNGNFSIVRADSNSTRGWRSRYYGHKEPAISMQLETNQAQVIFWSFFGFEDDKVELENEKLKIDSTVINLNLL